MQRYVAFLRGINLGKRRIAMARLAELFEELGFDRVETFIASGNVLFSTRKSDRGRLEQKIAAHLEKALGYEVDTFVRTLDEVVAIANRPVFADAEDAGATVHIGFLQQPLPAETARRLAAIRTEVDRIVVVGSEYYWRCGIRTSDSEVWGLPEMRALRLPTSSMRNRSSLRKLVAQHAAPQADG